MVAKANRLAENADFLKLLHTASARQRKQLIRIASKEQILAVCECAFNVLGKRVPLSSSQLKKLRKYKKFIYRIVDKRVPVPEKRRVLEQSGGFPFALLAPIVGGLLGGILQRSVAK